MSDKLDCIHPATKSVAIQKMYEAFQKGVEKLNKEIKQGKNEEELAKLRKRLGEQAWSLQNLYKYKLDLNKLKSLGVVPSMGTVIPRGQSGGASR